MVFDSWDDAHNFERQERLKNIGLIDPTQDVSRVIPQLVGRRRVPCYLFDQPFDDYDKGMISERLFKADQKHKLAKKRRGDKEPVSLEELIGNGHNPITDNDPTASGAIGNVMTKEINTMLDDRKKGISDINYLLKMGWNARQTSEILKKNEWTVRDEIEIIKKVKRNYLSEN